MKIGKEERYKKARQKKTSVNKEEGLQAEPCLSEPPHSHLLGRAEEKEAGDADATGLTPVYENGTMSEYGKAPSGTQRMVLP